jgi:hypothetical protein
MRPIVFQGLILAAICLSPVLNAGAPEWPLVADPLDQGMAYPSFVQPTASGEPESALFGCVRTNGKRFHEAVDIAPVLPRKRGEATDPVAAVHPGVVRHISTVSGNSSYGRYVVLEHPGLELQVYTLYAHLAKVEPGLQVGQAVDAGERLGTMGRSAGGYTIPRERAHLHLEIGLRLSDDFQQWYRRQAFTTPNKHGNFNGMNLVGLDPISYFEAFRAGRVRSPLEVIELVPPAVMVHVMTSRQPDFTERYPELVLPGCRPSERAGWEVLLSPWGLPLSMKALKKDELKGVSSEGDISVVGIDRRTLGEYSCRRIVEESKGKVTLGKGGQTIMELLFMPDRQAR